MCKTNVHPAFNCIISVSMIQKSSWYIMSISIRFIDVHCISVRMLLRVPVKTLRRPLHQGADASEGALSNA